VLRVTLDTNVYVSGLNFKGKPYELLELKQIRKYDVLFESFYVLPFFVGTAA
jgi:predicted nucleic acid-binding protein